MTGKTEVKKAVCVWCKGECGVLVYVRDGRLIKAEEDPDFPTKVWPATRGCVRLRAAAEWFYHPERLSFPLKRAGEKGEGKWETISWDQALDEIAGKLAALRDTAGPEAIAFTTGTTYKGEHSLAGRFFTLLGTPLNRASAGSICFWPRAMIADALTGWFPHFSVKPVTRCILIIGQEPAVSRPGPALAIREAREKGAKLIVIDPRRTRSASRADIWLQLRPGTDTALLLGMIQTIIAEGLYDKDFVGRWCHGFDALAERASQYPPERVAAIVDVPAEKIRDAARMYAANRPACILEGVTLEQLEDTFDALQARWILAALTGNIDVEGGEEQVGPHRRITSYGDLEPRVVPTGEQMKKQIGADRFKFLAFPGQRLVLESMRKVWWGSPLAVAVAHGPSVMRAVLTGDPYPVQALWSMGNNILATQPNVKLLYRALKRLDLYVVVDMWMTPSACLADYVLPCASWLERPILYDFNGYDRWMKAGEAALPPSVPGECDRKFDAEIFRELGIRMGQEAYWPWKTLEECYDLMLKPAGHTHRSYVQEVRCELKPPRHRKYEQAGFATPTGKVELSSTILEKLGYDPLPTYREPSETPVSKPELASEYPLTLITGGRVREFYHSDFRQVEAVRKLHPYPLLQIHPETAGPLGIGEGDWVWIETLRGRVRQKATLTTDIRADTVHAEHGWWYPELPAEEPWLRGIWESNIGVVLNDDPEVCDPRTGGWPLKTALCKVYKVKTYERDERSRDARGS